VAAEGDPLNVQAQRVYRAVLKKSEGNVTVAPMAALSA
jgi:hypothetical protein